MPEQTKPFVVTDRRKFSLDGTPRPDADREPREEESAASSAPAATVPAESSAASNSPVELPTSAAPEPHQAAPAEESADDLPPGPTEEEMEKVNSAYQQTSERLETAVRATNPGMDHPPAMDFQQIVQSVYMTAILQLGGGTEPGQQPKVDIMGARQSIDMLAVLAEKTKENLSADEQRLLDSALFEVRMGFLEVTQALARSAAARQPGGPAAPGAPGNPGRPSIVR